MAIDSRTKRLSMLNFGIGALLPDPSGSIDTGDQLTLLDLYRGIPAVMLVPGPFRVAKREMFVDGAGTGEVGGTGAVVGEQYQTGQTAGEMGTAR